MTKEFDAEHWEPMTPSKEVNEGLEKILERVESEIALYEDMKTDFPESSKTWNKKIRELNKRKIRLERWINDVEKLQKGVK